MKFIRYYTLAFFLLCLGNNVFGVIPTAKRPEWIKPLDVGKARPELDKEALYGCYYLLVDVQLKTDIQQYYRHYAYTVVSEVGVQNNANITIDYNPAYEKLQIHSINVYRDGMMIDYTKKADIKDLQQGGDVSNYVYEETRTAYIVLDDIRPNDVIEYDYTVTGENPVFNGRFSFIFQHDFSFYVDRLQVRLVKPQALALQVKCRGEQLDYTVVREGNDEDRIWRKEHCKAIDIDDHTPIWHPSYASVEISEYTSWQEVKRWGIKVFEHHEPLNAGLREEINRIKKQHHLAGEKVIAATRFVQQNIRYLGLEIGENSHRPKSPNNVYQQRFGDCKDKSLLLSTMLNAMDIEAWPAFVSTWRGPALKETQPSPLAFNHVVVKVLLDGKEYWLDPTSSYQGGDLKHTYFPPYVYALTLDRHGSGLDSIAGMPVSRVYIKETYKVQKDGSVILNVTTDYSGCDADNIRYQLASHSREEIKKNYLDFYTNLHPDIVSNGDLAISDDEEKNVVSVTENYTLPHFWENSESSSTTGITLSAHEIKTKIQGYTLKEARRTDPLYLEYPVDIVHWISLQDQKPWAVEDEDVTVENDYFSFTKKIQYINGTIDFMCTYNTFAPYVPVEDVPDFIKAIHHINDTELGIVLSPAGESGQRVNVIMLLLLLVMLAICVVAGVYVIRHRTPVTVEHAAEVPESIGGWMVLPMIGLFVSIGLSVYCIVSDGYFNVAGWENITNPAFPDYHVLWAPLLVWELFSLVFSTCAPIVLLILMFRQEARFPKYMIGYYVVSLGLFFIHYIGLQMIPALQGSTTDAEVVRQVLGSAIWIAYFAKSGRCKRTFVK